MEVQPALLAVVAIAAFCCAYLSIALGVGYGTILTPLLLLMGFLPLQIIPAVLLSQLVSGFTGGIAHHRLGNIELDFKQDRNIKKRLRGLGYIPSSSDAKVIFILAICGTIGVLIGVFTAVNIPTVVLETYIGVLVLLVGMIVLIKKTVGLLSSFNKGMTGGGYVPLITGGQIVSGREVKSAIGSTTLAVAFTCAVGFLCYALVEGNIYWALAGVTCGGAVIAAPFAAITAKKLTTQKLKTIIGISTCILGALTLVKAFIF
jgi:uncharacterized membrane protein YfcA